jgi:predicted enzyme related to lactoylglutathione lyase
MASADVQGKFLWHELVTADPGAAGAFYGKVLGWTPQAWDKDPSYTVLLTPKGPVGGIMKPGADAHGAAASAHWLGYVGTARIEETVASAQRLGGRVVKGASDIPGGGRYALLADPQGAAFGIYSPSPTGPTGSAADAFAWHELRTSDHAAALRFYRELFGWEQVAVHDMGGAVGPYVIFGRGGQQLGGMFSSQGGAGAHWLAYVRVSSASKAADAAKAAGGRVINGPMQVPGGSWTAQLADPHGAAIAVNQPAATESAQPAKPAAAPPPPKPVVKPFVAPAPAPAARPASVSSPAPAAPSGGAKPAIPAAPRPAAAAPAAAAPHATAKPPAPAPRPVSVLVHPSAPAKPAEPPKASAPAKVAAPVKPAAPAKPAAPVKKAAAPAKKVARKKAARKSAARKKKTARPARKASAAKKRSTKKTSAARARRGKSGRSGKRAGAGARKAARGKRARKRAK